MPSRIWRLYLSARIYHITEQLTVAESFGISQLVIGLTVIAISTSLPELATFVAATVKGESDVALGNAIGSNMLNIFSYFV